MLSSFELQAQRAVPAPMFCNTTTNTVQVLVTRYNQLDSSACSVVTFLSTLCHSNSMVMQVVSCITLHIALILVAKQNKSW